jgi:uncharacterized phage protein (TIGR02220 family)
MKYKSSHPYFPHIIDRFNEDSFVTLRREYGVEGYGFYWMILEIMAKREDCCLIVSENLYKNLSFQIGISAKKVKALLDFLILLSICFQKEEKVYNQDLLNWISLRNKISESNKNNAYKRWNNENIDDAMALPTQCDPITNALQSQCDPNPLAMRNDANKTKLKETKRNTEEENIKRDEKANPLFLISSSSKNLDLELKSDLELKTKKEFYSKVISYLNEKTNCHFKTDIPKTEKLINTRVKEGFILDDFYKVIDNKCLDWLHDPKWSQYLKPETLFSNKFEGYLNRKQFNNTVDLQKTNGKGQDTIMNTEQFKEYASNHKLENEMEITDEDIKEFENANADE